MIASRAGSETVVDPWAGMRGHTERLLGVGIYVVASLVGIAAFLEPLVVRYGARGMGLGEGRAAPFLLSVLVSLCVAALLFEAGSSGMGTRAVAVLGVLVATNSVLRFAETALPGPGGFTPIFALVILSGYAFGPRFGFLMGALTLAVSGVVTGGVGPWLPFQMLAAGWVGLTGGLLRPRTPRLGTVPRRREVLLLAAIGLVWGFAYGVIMTLWFWPYVDVALLPAPAGAADGPLPRFALFYLATSFAWDAFGAAGNAALIALAGAPVLVALGRFERRCRFQSDSAPASAAPVRAATELSPRPADGLARLPAEQEASADPSAVRAWHELTTSPEAVHPRAWASWLAAVALLVSATRNPLVLAAALLAIAATGAALPRRTRILAHPWRLAVVAMAVCTLYNALVSHAGSTVIARLPLALPLVGGPVTLEAVAYGFLTGLSLVLLLAAFATFFRAVPTRGLVRLVPRAFGSVTLALVIALTYVPAVLEQIAAVREAQAVRGHRARGVRDVLPLAMPVLIGALERAFGLAESMSARGLVWRGHGAMRGRAAMLASLVALLAGWLAPAVGLWAPSSGRAALAAGAAGLVGTLVWLGRRAPATSYRPDEWRWTDTVVAVASWPALVVAWLDPASRAMLAYTPYPDLARPPATVPMCLALVGLVAPAMVVSARRRRARRETP